MSRYQVDWYCSWFLQTLVVIFPRKSTQVKIHAKIAIFWLGFSVKNPVKSDKLALIEGKILNLMFFHINTPVVPIEIWLPVTHDQRQKTLKVDSVLLFRDILKTKSCLECGSSLSNSRMWPGILPDEWRQNCFDILQHIKNSGEGLRIRWTEIRPSSQVQVFTKIVNESEKYHIFWNNLIISTAKQIKIFLRETITFLF